jgi:hypothetical protein
MKVHTKFLMSRTWTRDHMVSLVEIEVEQRTPPEVCHNILRANRPYLNSFLPEELQLA